MSAPRFALGDVAAFLAVLSLAAFVLALGTLAWFEIPAGNRELFAGGMGGLNLILGAIANHYWRRLTSGSDPEHKP